MKLFRAALTALSLLILSAGLCIMLCPGLRQARFDRVTEQKIAEFRQETEEGMEKKKDPYDALYRAMQAYNRRLMEGDADALGVPYAENPLDFSSFGYTGNCIGYLSVPSLDLRLLLFAGASEEQMKEGACLLGGSSYPVVEQGVARNCVVAAHRGYAGARMFSDIEEISPGDRVDLVTRWDRLCYRVISCRVIRPWDTDAIALQPGKSLLTLLTCHPYGSNTERYLVLCEECGSRNRKGE